MSVQRVKQVAVMAGMVAVMTMAAATTARAQVADGEAQAQMAKAQAEASKDAAQMASLQAKMAIEMAPLQAKLAEEMVPLQAKLAADLAPMQAQMAAEMLPMQAKFEMQLAPLQAKLEMQMAPLQAAMMARSAAMSAQAAVMRAGLLQTDGELTMVGDPQVKDELFAGTEKFAKGASNVTDVNLDPSMMGMVSGKHGDLAHKLNFMVVRSYEYPHAGMYNMADVDAYRQKLKSGNWNCFIHTHESESGESTDICNRALPNNQGNEMVIMTVEPKELTFIHMSGNASLADLGKLGTMGGHVVPELPERPEKPEPPEKPEQ